MRRWSLRRSYPPAVRRWEDGAVVYNRLTGQTHVVDALAAAILAQLTDVPISEPELIARLTDVIPAEAVSADLNAAVASALADMDRLGLVDPVGQP